MVEDISLISSSRGVTSSFTTFASDGFLGVGFFATTLETTTSFGAAFVMTFFLEATPSFFATTTFLVVDPEPVEGTGFLTAFEVDFAGAALTAFFAEDSVFFAAVFFVGEEVFFWEDFAIEK